METALTKELGADSVRWMCSAVCLVQNILSSCLLSKGMKVRIPAVAGHFLFP